MAPLVAVGMVKDEVDVLEATLRNLARQVDRIVIADNLSTDGTLELLRDLAGELPLRLVIDETVGYWQARKMTALAEDAVEGFAGAWVIPFDADEVWRDVHFLAELEDGVEAIRVPGVDYRPTAHDAPGAHPFVAMQWRERDGSTFRPKVAFRWRPGTTIAQGNHHVERGGERIPAVHHAPTIAHYPIRSLEQFIRKVRNGAAAYEATDLPTGYGAHWRAWGKLTDEELELEYRERFWHADPEADGLLFDPA
jgi:glycosyltransferase involved in cell wall biosynthesis